ncbi:MAG: ABC-F family ATP-binding cassette domain-containing protein [Alphaproteobacteria bacterium]|jgi:ATP-binding cassette subfamily F protein 3|nr:ABC-F family ATP-binding cassette domain-containing protein [Alphaproteobacteria bacterium]
MLEINNITYRIAGRTLFEQASLSIPAGHHVGLVGPNGTGKSTLFKLIADELQLDGGDISMMSNTQMGMVRQDIPDDDTPLIDVVLAADTERASLFAELETDIDVERMSDIYMRLADINAYEAPSQAAIILSGLGFTTEQQSQPISDFSGGWKMRVALAAALFRKPNLLLLDEPTNHLDFEAIVWLETYLQNYEHTFIIISHDRETLNKVVTHIAHLDQLKLTLYTGNYDQFENAHAQKRLGHQALFDKQQAHKKKMMEFVDRFGAKASKAKQAQSRLRAIERMDMVDALIAERSTSFKFPQPEQISSPIITMDDVDVGYEAGKPILRKINLGLAGDDRVALLGANGNGKSTLVKLISDNLSAMAGQVTRNSKLRIGYFAQHQSDELDDETTPYEAMRKSIGEIPEAKCRALLGKFGFDKGKSDTQIRKLSGGEKARLLFCIMSHDAPHIMLLDEPTNHLDIDARQALIEALNGYPGCVILVSHDPHLVEAVADRLYLVRDAGVAPYDGDLQAYRGLIMEQRRKERADARKTKKTEKAKPAAQDNAAQAEKLESQLAELTDQRTCLETAMSKPDAMADSAQMEKLLADYAHVETQIGETEKAWFDTQS